MSPYYPFDSRMHQQPSDEQRDAAMRQAQQYGGAQQGFDALRNIYGLGNPHLHGQAQNRPLTVTVLPKKSLAIEDKRSEGVKRILAGADELQPKKPDGA